MILIKYTLQLSLLNLIVDGEDYRGDSIVVSIAIEEISKSFTINIINDDVSECNEKFSLMLSIPTLPCGVVIGRNDTIEVTIRDDDGRRSVSDYVVLFTY